MLSVIEAPLPKAPLYTSIVCHWLAIEGVQPASPENAPVEVLAAPSDNKKPEQKYDLPLYFDKITEVVVTRSDSVLFKEAYPNEYYIYIYKIQMIYLGVDL
ncbi:unnamed protein product [Camellia sinensis]